MEAAWHRARTATLRRFAANAELLGSGGERLSDETAKADLFLGQLVFRAAVRGPYSVFAGLGIGHLRFEDPTAVDIGGAAAATTASGGPLPAIRSEITSDESALMAGGSIGVTARAGRFFIRQRLEAWFGRESAATYRLSLPLTEELDPASLGIEARSRLRPGFLMFTVDIGFNLR